MSPTAPQQLSPGAAPYPAAATSPGLALLGTWWRALQPRPDAPLEDQLFQLITLIWGVITLAVVTPANGVFIASPARAGSTMILVAIGVFSLITWWQARKGRRWVNAFFVGHIVALDAMWFPGGGSTTATLLFHFSLLFMPLVFATGRTRLVMLGAIAVNVVALFWIEFAHPGWVVLHPSHADRLLDMTLTTLIVLGGVGAAIGLVVSRYHAERQHLAQANVELNRALAEVRTLQGLLPMCAWCRRIRDEAGRWSVIEAYVESHTGAKVTHAMCPDCAARLAAEIEQTQPATSSSG